MKMIQNPILRGFNPDPSIIRVGDDYYIAVSSFEWFPGVPIYHSRDLMHWQLIGHALKTKEYLDLTGEEPSKGVWAPALSYNESEKRFYLIYSNVHCQNPWFFDVDNYLIWTDDIKKGEWSKPVYLNSSGFDPSLFMMMTAGNGLLTRTGISGQAGWMTVPLLSRNTILSAIPL